MKTTLLPVFVAACLFSCSKPPDDNGQGGGGGDECPPSSPTTTYYRDVLPITQRSCNGCHVEGGIAPFPLDSYEAAKAKAPLMVNATEERRMPPWKASKDCGGEFVGDRSLTQEQIDTIANWYVECMPEGNPADAPEPIDHTADQLPRADFEFTMTEAYTPTLRDDYRCFTVDPALSSAKNVIGYDILPGSKKVVHHVIMYIVTRSQARRRKRVTRRPGGHASAAPTQAEIRPWERGPRAARPSSSRRARASTWAPTRCWPCRFTTTPTTAWKPTRPPSS